eukprot:scaffold166843_cov35-Prasinocladus_malaysianus.AAC.2
MAANDAPRGWRASHNKGNGELFKTLVSKRGKPPLGQARLHLPLKKKSRHDGSDFLVRNFDHLRRASLSCEILSMYVHGCLAEGAKHLGQECLFQSLLCHDFARHRSSVWSGGRNVKAGSALHKTWSAIQRPKNLMFGMDSVRQAMGKWQYPCGRSAEGPRLPADKRISAPAA